MKTERGFCPRCDGVGRVAEPCQTPGCRLDHYGHIPPAYYRALKDKPQSLMDVHVGRLLDDYLLLSHLGKGGYGKVFYAVQLPLMMPAAVKLLNPIGGNQNEADELITRFETEARAMARLSHPNVVRLLKYGGHHPTPYLAMEFVEGDRTLRSEVTELRSFGQRLSARDCGGILSQVLFALEAAHDKGILHLDLKPDNIMLQSVPGYRRLVRLVDFGLGRLLDSDDIRRGEAIGTPEYIAPEQLKGREVGPFTDLYSAGVLTFTLLYERSPFRGDDIDALIENKLDPDADPAENLPKGDWPSAVTDFVTRALAVPPSRRFQTASAFLAALEPVIAFEEERRG